MDAPRKSLTPLIKWSGGKRAEIPLLKPAYPKNIRRVVEPFAGGAAVSLDLNPGMAVLGDVSAGLVEFYQMLGQEQAREELLTRIEQIQKVREAVAKWVGELEDRQVGQLAQRAVLIKTSKGSSRKSSNPSAGQPISSRVLPPGLVQGWVGHIDCGDTARSAIMHKWMEHDIEASLVDKMSRVDRLGRRRDEGSFNDEELRPHLLTAIHAGVYTSLRRTYNEQALTDEPIVSTRSRKGQKDSGAGTVVDKDRQGDRAWRVAAWYVVRNLCYAGMFRFGPNGKFNVPYGGISYNSRDFSRVRQTLLSDDVKQFFDTTEVHLLDFDQLMDKYDNFGGPDSGDFIFLDPPYDSAFSRYNSEGDFTQEDQRRLARRLRSITTPWMLVIKKTDFIVSLYQDQPGEQPLYRAVFGKSYQVNIRNRNEADVEHFVVTNYPIPVEATVEKGGAMTIID